MDISSFGKASKVIREIDNLNQKVIGEKAESHFLNVDARLDWIEAQAGSIITENTNDVDLTKGSFDQAEVVLGSVQLAKLTETSFVEKGTWESGVIDLGEGWQKTKAILVDKKILGET